MKFGIFICLLCVGVYCGLGVYIFFVCSILMDVFKVSEIEWMRFGGNEGWRIFFEEYEDIKMIGVGWEDVMIVE